MARIAYRALIAFLAAFTFAATPVLAQPVESFDAFIKRFEGKAAAAGIQRDVYRRATAGLTPDPRTPNLIAGQPEFTTPIWEYLDQRVSKARVERGRAAYGRNRQLFETIAGRYGVDPFVIAAIWGIESDYGAVLDNTTLIRPVVRSLATVAHQHRGRVVEDEAELIAALKLIQEHGWTNDTLVGSWAGAIGHTQVIVSGLLDYGADGDGDGQINPHLSLADAIATTAKFLKSLGYQSGQDWGFEVEVPPGFDLLLADRESLHPVAFFADRGIRRVAGRQFGDQSQPVFLYLPAGAAGPKFLMTANYLVFKGYNFSDSYALSVAHLTDRLKGGGAFVQDWPRKTRFPNLQERIVIQRRLTDLGYYSGDVDGRIGPVTQRAFQLFQSASGLTADGFITQETAGLLVRAER